jgi:hypothetical protein
MAQTQVKAYRPSKKEKILSRVGDGKFFDEFIQQLPEDFDARYISYQLSYNPPKNKEYIDMEKGVGITREITSNNLVDANIEEKVSKDLKKKSRDTDGATGDYSYE